MIVIDAQPTAQRRLRPARTVCEGLSRVPGNWHAQFLGGGRAARLSRYPTGLFLGVVKR